MWWGRISRGLAVESSDPFWMPGNYDWGIVLANGYGAPPRSTRTTYDRHGRPSKMARLANGTQQSASSTVYDGWITTTVPPAGGAVRTVVDGLGRTVSSKSYANQAATGASWDTTYTYTVRDELATTTDPNGNVTSTTYDIAGRPTSTNDPNRGVTTYAYDANSNVTSMTPANNLTQTNQYDALNRLTATYVGGYIRTGYSYDAAQELGLLDSSTTYEYGAPGITQYPYTIDVNGYDGRNRPTGTSYVIPLQPGLTDGLNGTYNFTQNYNDADQPVATGYPTIANITAETATQTYHPTGQPRSVGGWQWYVRDTGYNYDGTMAARAFGAWNHNQVVQTPSWDPATGRLANLHAQRGLVGWNGEVFQNSTYTYDDNGNVTNISHDPDASVNSDHNECFTIDPRNQMTAAFTTLNNQNCNVAFAGQGPTGYNQSFSYNQIGNFTQGPAGSYAYLSGRPHAPSQIGTTSYTYDALGRRSTSTTGSSTTNYHWNVSMNNPVGIDRDGARIETNVYSTNNQRLIRQTPTETTLYLGGLSELTKPTNGTVTAKRYYQSSGQTVAVRSYSHIYTMIANHQNSTIATASVYTNEIEHQQYLPYGNKRGGDTLNSTEQGFIGQTEDDNTGLVYLNNRHYDPSTGVFISVDPLVTMTGEPYIYGSANPITMSDPTGLCSTSYIPELGCSGTHKTTGYSPTGAQQDKKVRQLFRGFDIVGNCGGCIPSSQQREPASPSSELPSDITAEKVLGLGSDAAEDIDEWLTFGGCGSVSVSLIFVGAEGAACGVSTPEGDATLLTGGLNAGFQIPNASLSGGVFLSNATSRSQLKGPSACINGSAGGGTITMCSGIRSGGQPNGVITLFTGAEKSIIDIPSGTVSFTYTWVLAGGGTSNCFCNPDGSYVSGGQQRWMNEAGIPWP